ncbi:phosphate/phosphite/phosphonate ABC transporter substrate-binding protein [Methylorubrum extorquens]|jgi:phosphonate transport system substrate-binding protein|uniref:Phosphonate transport system substrate-binding protein n=2 Tax=Methylorubrum extorquens TaxID=408 RepID=C5B6A1_METEA|nr:phosphate/phosphite/phosphonate ABC transporter substrate-binding protein [Methylorubrum extorquens]ACS43983.1 putative phosphonate transport system substrate-binding protein [Methylorubrum extorquens AM1]EHP95076.1 phosphonate ABC transporter, periplasmic phosphonate-binding protein [Methylorubrum extorquens DSM 13060]MCP1546158.1 phosphonate transport system substrate-binding protein [Methylorubrum extorquens]MCP1590825.1 phosphonate transport system substrate-binding protein [Methylorubru
MISRRTFGAGLALSAFLRAGPSLAQGADPDTLKVALLPDESASTIIQNNQGLKTYLEQGLGKRIELVVTTDYSSMIEAMRFKRIDLAYFGPLSYVLAKSRSPGIEPFAALVSGGQPTYSSYLIANVTAGIARTEDVKGKTVGFGDTASTSSHLIPRALLKNAGLEAGKDYSFQHLGTHDAVARAVQAGHVQAGGLSKPIFTSLVATKSIDPAKVHVVAESRPIPNYPWTVRGDLAPGLKEKIKTTFLEIKDPAILKPFKAEAFSPITDADYDVLRETAKLLNIDLTKVKS